MRRRINRLNGGGRILRQDSFTDSDGTTLASHPTDDGGVWIDNKTTSSFGLIATNRLKSDPLNVNTRLTHSSRLRRKNGAVECDVIRVAAGLAAAAIVAIDFRSLKVGVAAQPSLNYEARYTLISTTTTSWGMLRNGAGLGSLVSQVLTQDQVYRLKLECRGSRILIWIDGAIIFNTDDAYTTRGFRPGLNVNNNNAGDAPLRIDNWRVVR